MAARFTYLNSSAAGNPVGIWNWAKRLISDLERLRRVLDLADLDLTGKAGYKLVVKADESGFELVP
jgi:hypothetical protein